MPVYVHKKSIDIAMERYKGLVDDSNQKERKKNVSGGGNFWAECTKSKNYEKSRKIVFFSFNSCIEDTSRAQYQSNKP